MDWHFDELKQTGVDLDTPEQAQAYDQKMSMRDMQKEAQLILDALQIDTQSSILEIGCGTGTMARSIAKKCSRMTAIDVSQCMVDYAIQKAQKIENVEFQKAGFLTFVAPAESFDGIFTQIAWHHLPDFWKTISLLNMNRWLKPKGKVLIRDVIYSFAPSDHEKGVNKWLEYCRSLKNHFSEKEIKTHIREEYSTFTWIVEEMFRRTGFAIVSHHTIGEIVSIYVIEKC